ncbi:MAG: PTS system mannose/fructose/sorbose family transporter subunit IID, partial [Deltaproteobacteria bacterium]
VRVFLRSLFLQASWNPRGMQNVGFADAIGPALTELYPEPAERAKAVARHLEFFNCHPYMAAAILGGAVRLEERVASGELPAQTVAGAAADLGAGSGGDRAVSRSRLRAGLPRAVQLGARRGAGLALRDGVPAR